MTPLKQLMTVLFPALFAPSSPTNCPCFSVKSTPCKTEAAPYPALSPTISSMKILAEIRITDELVLDDLLGGSVGDLLTKIHDDDSIGDAHHDRHDVLHKYEGHALAAEPANDVENHFRFRER